MAGELQPLSRLVILRVFAAAFVLLLGLAMLFKSGPNGGMVLGAFCSAIGLTFFALLWLYSRR
jgi:hypothetical protein